MTLQQMRYLCAVVDSGYNLSQAAARVCTSTPAVSTQIRSLERDLETEILIRRRGRILGLTEPGAELVACARDILRTVERMRAIGSDFSSPDHGTLTLGLTHMHARYGLIVAIERFRKAYPAVQVIIRELKPTAIFEQVTSGEVDIGVANESPPPSSKLARLTLHHSARNDLSRSVFVPRRHGLLKAGRISLEELARHPFIMLDSAVTGARLIGKAFADKGLAPNIVMRATTADVIKAYVKLGLGVAVLPTITYDRRADQGLRTIDVTHLFGTTTITIALNPRGHLRRYMYEFISLIEPSCTREKVEFQLRAAASGR